MVIEEMEGLLAGEEGAEGEEKGSEAVVLDILEVATSVIQGPVATSLSRLVMQVGGLDGYQMMSGLEGCCGCTSF